MLLETLWRGRPTATAGNALQVHVHALRAGLGRERIATEAGGYLLRVGPLELDVQRFEGLLARGRGELAAGDAESAAATLRGALAVWRGPAFADVGYEPFAQAEIARLDELRTLALEERIEADLALARHGELVPELEALVAEHPARERLHAQLMLALYRSGRQADALAVYRRARRALREELGLEPGPALRELQAAVLRHDASLLVETQDVRRRRHLPAAATSFVGRRRELEELGELLRTPGARLVTLTGPGGTGKTRLALQAAHDLAAAFDDGVYFVDLAPLRDPALVPSAVAAALGLEERPEQAAAHALATRLRDRRVLLLLDNFEVVDEAAPLVSDLLRAAPLLTVLVTSRMPLRLAGEHEVRVPALPLEDALRLFAVRARAVAPRFRRPSEETEEVSELCTRLDCLPLAIELAAARTREYSAAELLHALPGRLDLAGEGARDLPARQRTLRGAIDWSYELLAAGEAALFARLAVFAGGCTEAAAQAVCGAGRGALAALVGRSLLVERPGPSGELRFGMLDTIREYALERLDEDGEAEAVRRRHLDWLLALAAEARPHLVAGEGQQACLARAEGERDNVRAALAWALAAGLPEPALELAVALERFWWVRGPAEGLGWLERCLDAGELAPALRAGGLEAAGGTAWFVGEHERAYRLFSEAGAIYREAGDRAGEARILNRLGPPLHVAGRYDEAERVVRRALALHRELGDTWETALSLEILGTGALERGDVARGVEILEESASLARESGNLQTLIYVLVNLSEAIQDDDPPRAASHGREALVLARELGDGIASLVALGVLSLVTARGGDRRRAGLLWGAAERLSETLGPTMWDRERERLAGLLRPTDGAFEDGRVEGRAIPLEDAVAVVLGAGAADGAAPPEAVPDAPSDADQAATRSP